MSEPTNIDTQEIKICLARLDEKVDNVLENQHADRKRSQEIECRLRVLENHKSKITGAVAVIGTALTALFAYILKRF
jgi:hypothetical protein